MKQTAGTRDIETESETEGITDREAVKQTATENIEVVKQIVEIHEDKQEMKQTTETSTDEETVKETEIIDKQAVTQTVESVDSVQTVKQTVECKEEKILQRSKETLQIIEG